MAKAKAATKTKKPLTKTQIAANIAEATGLTKKDVTAVFDALAGEIKRALAPRGPGVFTIPGLIKITKKRVKARPAGVRKNPFTGEMKEYPAKPAHNTVRVRALKKLKDMV